MLGDVQRLKASYHFGLIDEDGNGLIEASDFALRAQRLAQSQNLTSEAARKELRQQVVEWWNHFCQVADYDGDTRVTLEEWIAYWDSLQAEAGHTRGNGQSAEPPHGLGRVARGMCRAIDRNETGRIVEEEYASWLEAWGADGHEKAFRRLDRERKGYLTEEDVLQAVQEFYLSNDPSAPGNALYGIISE